MIVAVYKEKGPTSRDVLNKIKRFSKEKKIGHAGTLDPLAEGVLVVGVGRSSTKKLHTIGFDEKDYLAVIRLGEESITDDTEGEKRRRSSQRPLLEEVKKAVAIFQGVIQQRPPFFSAVKIEGREAYKWAREGKLRRPKERKAAVKKINIVSYRYPLLKISVTTGKGVYIRSLARDIGEKLETGGYLLSLIRMRVGRFKIADCVEIDTLCATIKKYSFKV